jgi:hypothetical protein
MHAGQGWRCGVKQVRCESRTLILPAARAFRCRSPRNPQIAIEKVNTQGGNCIELLVFTRIGIRAIPKKTKRLGVSNPSSTSLKLVGGRFGRRQICVIPRRSRASATINSGSTIMLFGYSAFLVPHLFRYSTNSGRLAMRFRFMRPSLKERHQSEL